MQLRSKLIQQIRDYADSESCQDDPVLLIQQLQTLEQEIEIYLEHVKLHQELYAQVAELKEQIKQVERVHMTSLEKVANAQNEIAQVIALANKKIEAEKLAVESNIG